MNINVKDIRTPKEKKSDWKNIQEEWKSMAQINCTHGLSKSEYCEAKDYYLARQKREESYKADTYEKWLLLHFVKSFRQFDKKHFHLAAPECFSIIKEMSQEKNLLYEKENKAREIAKQKGRFNGKERKELSKIAKENELYQMRGSGVIFDVELMDLVLESDPESWEKRYTPNYLRSMAIIYQVLKARGITPSPEEEEKLKYEILEKEVLDLIQSYNGLFEYEPAPRKDPNRLSQTNSWRNGHVFPDIAEIYLGISNRIEWYQLSVFEYSRDSKFYIVKNENGEVKRYTYCLGNSAWNFFKKEDLRELLFIADAPDNLEKIFKKELAEHGIDIESITYENVMQDEEWKDYVFREHKPTALGGKGSPMLINPPMMMELLIDRVLRLKEECKLIEENKDTSLLQRNEDYLHKKWEYYAAKLQVLLLDIRRANEMKKWEAASDDERKTASHINSIKYFWKNQLGKYADNWITSDYQLANEHIEAVIEGKKEEAWQTSKDAYYRKKEIAAEMQKINEALVAIGSYSPHYNDGLPFRCPDAISSPFEKTRNYTLLVNGIQRQNDILYDAGNDEQALCLDKNIGITNNVYKAGIIRFDKKQENAQMPVDAKKAIQEKFLSSTKGTDLKEDFDKLLKRGISADTLRSMLDEIEQKNAEKE